MPSKPDWRQVSLEYARSTLDIRALDAFTRNASRALLQASVAFDGYTDGPLPGIYIPDDLRPRRGLVNRLFGEPGLAHQHIGFWAFASTGGFSRSSDGSTVKSDQHRETWVLLEDGRIARAQTYTRFINESLNRTLSGSCIDLVEGDHLLILDHKERAHRDRHSYRRNSHELDETRLEESNYLITGRKGGGLRKRITQLLRSKDVSTVH